MPSMKSAMDSMDAMDSIHPNVNTTSRHRPYRSFHLTKATLILILTLLVFLAFVGIISILRGFSASSASVASLADISGVSTLSKCPHGEERTWHGGHPADTHPGSCWCGGDGYCMCTPSVAIDVVLYIKRVMEGGADVEYDIWVVRRKDTGQLATIGGFIELGETAEMAVLRETEEETGIIIPPELIQPQSSQSSRSSHSEYAQHAQPAQRSPLQLIGVYSDPRRDNRRHIISMAYALELRDSHGVTVPKAGDDAKEVISVPLRDVGEKYVGEDWYADHLTILLDFKERVVGGLTGLGSTGGVSGDGEQGAGGLRGREDSGRGGNVVRKGELYEDVARSTCSSLS